MAESERGERREVRGAEERAHKIRKWRDFKIKHFLKLAFVTKFIFSEARVGGPHKAAFSRLEYGGLPGERKREEEGRQRARQVRGER